jgi:pimeloyl-ACP methyl ester carboxylesterase
MDLPEGIDTTGRVEANGVQFAYLSAGEPDAPLALLLHGFPDTAATWRHLMPKLADAGFRAVAPYLRGYAPTEVPADGRYQTGALAVDACRLHEALGGDGDAVIVGHDWGAFATYGAAALEPDRWRRVVTMAVPPAAALGMAFMDYDQIKRSFYIWFFQSPLAEIAVPLGDLAFIDGLWADWSPGYDGAADAAAVKDALRDPANLSAAIGYYRAMFDPSLHGEQYAEAQAAGSLPTPQPTLYLHGLADGCLNGFDADTVAAALPTEGSKVEMVPDVGHFLHLERPDVVDPLVLEFLQA